MSDVQQFYDQGKHGPPVDGVTLAGQAEPGARLDVMNYGSYVNVGTREHPIWQLCHDPHAPVVIPLTGRERRRGLSRLQ